MAATRNCSVGGVILFGLCYKMEDASIQQLDAHGNNLLRRVELRTKVRELMHNGYNEVL